jgi:hypothetical protein
MNKSFIFNIETGDINDNFDETYKTSSNICLPLCSLGFQNFLVRTKNYMNITSNLQYTNEFYYVVNPYEIQILNHNESIVELTKKYLNDVDNIDDTFYKIWEILYIFDILKDKECIYAVFSNNSNGILQAIINYKKHFKLDISKDKIFNISDEEVLTTTKIIKNFKGKEDITHIKTMITFKKEFDKIKKNANLIIADSGIETFTSIEPEMYNILISEIIIALKVQAKDGHFILKVFETFTLPTVKLIYFTSSFYESVQIYKPYYSKQTSSEKYIIFKNFKFDDNSKFKKIELLENIYNKTKQYNIYDIWTNLKLSNEYLKKITYINIKIANWQQIMINDIVNYIKENNYFGDKYHMYKEKQIIATNWWIDNFILNKDFDIKKHSEMYEADYNNFLINLI